MGLTAVPTWAWMLVLSLAGNGLLGWAWLDARDRATATIIERDDARADATACSDATEALRELADKRAIEARRAQALARAAASGHQQRANTILSTPAAVPGDTCASAQVRIDGWLKGRAPQ
jgi:hypothetical protein